MKTTRFTVMEHQVRRHGWRRGAELGVWQGALFGYLLAKVPTLYLIGVDSWAAVGPYASKDMVAAEAMARQHLARHAGRCEIIKANTVTAAAEIADASLDFVFIDASHDMPSVLADIRAWRCKVDPGGALMGHDANLPSVQSALNEELQGWHLLGANVWMFRVV